MSTSDASGGTGAGAPGPGGGGGGPNVVVSTGGGSGVAAKITHVKTTTIDGSGSGLGIGTIMTSGGLSNTGVGGIKVATSNIGATLGATPIALNSSQAGTAFRAIGAGGQSTQVRVVMPPGAIMPQSMIKQLEGAAAAAASGRTQITAIPASGARTVSNTSITVTRPVTQTTYLPRAGVTATQMTGVGVAQGQRLVTPIRTTQTSVTGAATVAGLTAAGSFVRGTAVSRNTSSPATTVISPAANTTWMAANTTGQVQLIRAISHQPRQRLITTQGISSVSGGGTATSGTLVATTATLAQGGGIVVGSQQQQQVQQSSVNQATMQAVSSHQQQQQQQQQTYVATLATVLPPRQQHQTATLVYSNVSTSQPQTPTHQFNSTVSGQRFAVATPLTAGTGGGGATARQIRPIQLPKSFSATKLNTTSISIRSPNLPQLTPTLATSVSAANSPRSNTITGAGGTTGNVIPTTNLSTTRIIQLQQQPGSSAQQIIGSTGRLASNVMLQPIIVNASAGGKIGIRPPVNMAAKVQPSLTITQLGIGKLPGSSANVGGGSSMQQQQQNLTASIQTMNTSNSSGGNASPSICTVNSNLNTGNLVNVSQGGQLLTTQNVVSSTGGATVVPLAITTRGGAGGNILTGTITPIKNANGITVGKVMAQAQVAGNSGHSDGHSPAPTSVFIHHASAPQRPHSGSGAQVATSNIITSGASSVITAGNTTGGGSGASAFLPAGSTFYYESVPASSVQVSTGVLSLTTTTVTSSTMSQQQQIVSNSGANMAAITSLPYASHAPSSTATFTVVPSSGVRTIGQLQLPVSSGGGTQIQAVPVRFSAHLAQGVTSGSSLADGTHIAVGQPTQIVAGTNGQQILIPAPQQQSSAAGGQQQTQHMVIPLQTSIKVTSGGGSNSSSSAVVSNFLRKREAEGSPVRAAKNLAPTFLSMNSNVSLSGGGGVGVGSSAQLNLQSISTAGAFNSNSNTVSTSNASSSSTSMLTVESLNKKDRIAAAGSTRSSRAVSPASSDGSTTVSANSSPGIEQQMQDGNLVLNHQRMASANDSTHFNPINDLYSNHHTTHASAHSHHHHHHHHQQQQHQQQLQQQQHHQQQQHQQQHQPATASISRNSSLDQQHSNTSHSQLLQNGSVIDYPPRKKSRRSTNDSQHSTQSQTSLSLPPPTGGVGNNSGIHHGAAGSHMPTGNGPLMMAAAGPSHDLNNVAVVVSTNHNTQHNNQLAANAADAEYKENTKPTEYILRKPRNCTLLNTYKQNWKAANNHFQRYSDIKPREERRPTVIDLANQANVLGKINGWKIHHLRSQMEDLVENESNGYDKLATMLKQMELHEKNPDIERISELLKGNMQRSKIIVDGVNEAQNQIMKIFEHKSHISDIITRCASKRNFKKRDKV